LQARDHIFAAQVKPELGQLDRLAAMRAQICKQAVAFLCRAVKIVATIVILREYLAPGRSEKHSAEAGDHPAQLLPCCGAAELRKP
jgi:hypothetical protein